ncbi:Meiotic recombination SPO11-2 [Chlorella sorokiniana]|uniref:DNA topoisomerase (ATP-hydrolyzing) n=1 Tax=Chlorella sorokiniana TaxID=3076 RepID=A0A2P6U0X7_CHLSO|nr:Meiotic recombination SPO11-2 [Chlorella sorokiniana]|eukprot:PRW59963.1 Meiotic recombination SPO11-2 [Chlorella sorokiniana]
MEALLAQYGFGGLGGRSQQDDEEEEQPWVEEEEEAEEGEAAGLSFGADTAEVLRRIRSATLWFVSQLCEGRLSDIQLVNQAPQADDSGSGTQPRPLRATAAPQRCLSLLGRHPESAEQVARLWVLLSLVHDQLMRGEQATQRELWYKLKTCEVFRSPRDVGEAVQDAISLLQVPRSALGITASSKGLVAGRLVIHDRRTGTETDCIVSGSGGVAIPGDIARITGDYAFQTDAQLILVIEKDAVFQRLLQQRFFDTAPCILVTGKGVPDLASRRVAFLSCLSSAFPNLPLVGLVDWNPAGCNILCIYRFGSQRMGLESPHYALPALRWLGARSGQLREADADAFQELTARDRSQATNLAASLATAAPEWAAELQAMLASGSKAEIEALDTVGSAADLPDLLLRCLEQGDCI